MNLKKQMIAQLTEGHKILGIALAGILYLICLTGTIVVFNQEMERWEKPLIPEMTQYSPEAIAKAALDIQKNMRANKNRNPMFEDLYISIPNKKMPRIVGGYDDNVRAYNVAGEYIGSASHPIVHFVSELHYYLHLPETFGMILVSVLGIFMLAIIIGGSLSLRKIFKDAFKLRPRETGHLGRADLHNRIGTWTLPFSLIVTATGSFIGFSQLIVFLVATFFHNGDFQKTMDPMLGSESEIRQIINDKAFNGKQAIVNSINQLKLKKPDDTPIFLIIHKAVSEKPNIEITAIPKQRIIFGEAYRFDEMGNLAAKNGYSDGQIGKQIYASLFPLHFGSYGGIFIQLLYFIVGLALCFLIHTGMEIWYTKSSAKGCPRPIFHNAWIGYVYGSTSIILICAALGLLGIEFIEPIFWLGLVSYLFAAIYFAKLNEFEISKGARIHRQILGLCAISLPIVHFIKFGVLNIPSAIINIPLLALGAVILISTANPIQQQNK